MPLRARCIACMGCGRAAEQGPGQCRWSLGIVEARPGGAKSGTAYYLQTSLVLLVFSGVVGALQPCMHACTPVALHLTGSAAAVALESAGISHAPWSCPTGEPAGVPLPGDGQPARALAERHQRRLQRCALWVRNSPPSSMCPPCMTALCLRVRSALPPFIDPPPCVLHAWQRFCWAGGLKVEQHACTARALASGNTLPERWSCHGHSPGWADTSHHPS
jgi:hypothetical protein